MNILHVTGANIWGGNEVQLKSLIIETNLLAINNLIFCFKGTPVEDFAQKTNIHFYSVDSKKPHSLALAKELSSYIKKSNIDVIHIHTTDFVLTYMLSCMLFGLDKPTVFSKKGISDKSSKLSPIKYNYKKIDKTICVSEAVKKSMQEVLHTKNHHKLEVVYDGINIEEITYKSLNLSDFNIPENRILIGNIANHTNAKDLPTLIKTADFLVNTLNRKDIHFVQIGKKTSLTDNLLKEVKTLGLENNFTFTGALNKASQYLKNFDCYIMSSKTEGLPITIMEAFKAKIPVVTTKAGGIPEAITNNENGFLCEVADYECLASKINILLNDKQLINKFTEASYNILLEKFNAKTCAERTINLYKSLLK